MLDLYYWPTPNGWKITILLGELGLPYNLIPVDIGKGVQFTAEFGRINPNRRIPALVDHDPAGGMPPVELFESAAIMMYLAEKHGRLMPRDVRAALSDLSAVTIEQLAAAGIKHDAPGTNYCKPDASGRMITVIPDNILVMTAGGFGAGWSMVIPCWSWALTQHPVTRVIEVPGRARHVRDAAKSELDFA